MSRQHSVKHTRRMAILASAFRQLDDVAANDPHTDLLAPEVEHREWREAQWKMLRDQQRQHKLGSR